MQTHVSCVSANGGCGDQPAAAMKPDFASMADVLHQKQLDGQTVSLPSPADRNPFKGARILIIDDDPTQRLLARDALEAHGFAIEEAADGPEGIVKSLVQRPDLVILDIVMPVLDGFTVCAELRHRKTTRGIPILIVTGLDDPASVERGFQLDATDYISKPVDWQTLPMRAKFILRNTKAGNAQPMATE